MSAKLSESPEISGLLYKKRGGFGKMMPNSWQYRYFILSKEGVLTYYDTDAPENKDIVEGKERGRLDLRGTKYDLVMEPTEGAPTPHLIIIQPEEGERWKLCADTKEDHARWWRLIEKFIPESSDRVINRPGHLNVQSDDDYDPNVISPTNHSKIKRASQLATRTIDVDAIHTSASVPSTPSSEHLHRNIHTPVPSTNPNSTKSTTSTKKKTGLRAAKDTSTMSQEWVEWVMVMTIVNICIYALVKHTLQLDQVIYILILNAIVAHTMTLRAGRTSKATQAAAVAQQQCADFREAHHLPLHLHASPPANFPPTTTASSISAPIAQATQAARNRSRSNSITSLVPASGAAGAGIMNSASTDSGVLVPGGGKPLAGILPPL